MVTDLRQIFGRGRIDALRRASVMVTIGDWARIQREMEMTNKEKSVTSKEGLRSVEHGAHGPLQ